MNGGLYFELQNLSNENDQCGIGQLINIPNIVGFHARNVMGFCKGQGLI